MAEEQVDGAWGGRAMTDTLTQVEKAAMLDWLEERDGSHECRLSKINWLGKRHYSYSFAAIWHQHLADEQAQQRGWFELWVEGYR